VTLTITTSLLRDLRSQHKPTLAPLIVVLFSVAPILDLSVLCRLTRCYKVFLATPHRASFTHPWQSTLFKLVWKYYPGRIDAWTPHQIDKLSTLHRSMAEKFGAMEILDKFRIVSYYQDEPIDDEYDLVRLLIRMDLAVANTRAAGHSQVRCNTWLAQRGPRSCTSPPQPGGRLLHTDRSVTSPATRRARTDRYDDSVSMRGSGPYLRGDSCPD
jgi:hypothetical protein